jgi:hypothetical protein
MGSSQSTQAAPQAGVGQRIGQAAATAHRAALGLASGLHTAAETTTALTEGAAHLYRAAAPAVDTLRLAMANLQRTQGVAFGGAGYFGGDDKAEAAKGLREYEASLSAKAKEDTIRRIGRALSRAGVPGVDPEGNLDDIVKQLVARIPNPRTNRQTFAKEAAAQKQVCHWVADALNAEFTPGAVKPADKMVDTSLSDVEICRAVGEWAHSFAAGVNTEFLAVHASVKNLLRNIETLGQIMTEMWTKIRDKVQTSGDDKLTRFVDPFAEVYSRAQAERNRQEEVLKNILHVQLAPAVKELEIAMRDESEQNALIKKLGLKPGTSEFADTLAMAVSGLGTAAAIAHRVHKALKQVGLTVRQYLDSKEYADFRRLVDEKLQSGAVKPDDLAKFLEAVEVLRTGFEERGSERFREALTEAEKMGGLGEDYGDYDDYDDYGVPVTGGRRRRGGAGDNNNDETKSEMAKRIKRRATEKELIVRDFAGRMARHYDELLAAVKALAPELGRSIPITDRTDALRDALARIRDMRVTEGAMGSQAVRIELALIGLYFDAEARQRKEQFVNALRAVAAACASLMELELYRPASALFARLKAAAEAIEKTIDYYADTITKKFGGEDDGADAKYGGDDPVLPEIARSGLSLHEAVNEFLYFYYIAKVRANLERTSAELEAYGEKYTELLGDAVASRLYTLETERKNILTRLEDSKRAAVVAEANAPMVGTTVPLTAAPADPARQDAWWTDIKKWVNDEYDTKTKFYRVVQAVDLYMKAFTAAIVKDPDAVRDIKKMLDGTQVIARWFSELTGDYIWRAFDRMGATDFQGRTAKPTDGDTATADVDPSHRHYYEKIGTADRPSLGVPQIGVRPGSTRLGDAKKAACDALDHFQALKNLVNAFARIGDKFGGRELRTQVFMSQPQIYKALMDYLKQSALSINASGNATTDPPAVLALRTSVGMGTGSVGTVLTAVLKYQVYFGSATPVALRGNYVIEDAYFVTVIKAMAAKIMTTLGVYDMFERATPLYDLTPTRVIIGGAGPAEELPEALEGAAELYFRLPRLAEFYRSLLFWDGFKAGGQPAIESLRVAMLPELEGVYGGLVRFVFLKAMSPETGDYSDAELRTLISEINAIYEHFRSKEPERPVQAALAAFVAEVNRRYGVVKRDDIRDYMAMIKIARKGAYGETNDTNYAILPGEEEVEVDRRAPSDRYTPPGAQPGAAQPFAGRPTVDVTFVRPDSYKAMVQAFRAKLETMFSELPGSLRSGAGASYSLLIRQAAAEIRRAQSRETKFAVAVKLVLGTSVVGADANKAFMFHETVVMGLDLLCALESLVRRFSDLVDRMDPRTIEDAIMDSLYFNAVGPTPPARLPSPARRENLVDIIKARLPPGGRDPDSYRVFIYSSASQLKGRGGIEAAATAAEVYTFLRLEEPGVVTLSGGLVPSKVDTDVVGSAVGDAQAQRAVRALRLGARLLTNYGLIMEEFLENLFDLCGGTQGLVELRYASGAPGGVMLSFAKLRDVIEKLLADVKFFFDIFRPYMPRDVVDRFENRGNPGSVFWLEEHLIDRRIRVTEDAGDRGQSLDGIARRAARVYDGLVRKTHVQLGPQITRAGLTDANPAIRGALIPASPADDATRYENYGDVLSGLVFYDAAYPNSGLQGLTLGGLQPSYPLGDLIQTARPPPPSLPVAAGGPIERFLLYRSEGGMTPYRSLLFDYNQLVARYLEVVTDQAGMKKIYYGLINAYANGVASRSVVSPPRNTYPDLALAGETFGIRGDPKPGAVLFQSLGWVLQRLIKDTNLTTQIPDHLVTTLVDVPLYMKETLRANLPGFVKLFDLLSQKGDFLKQLLQKTPIRVARPSQRGVAGAVLGAAVDPGVKIRAAGGDRLDGSPEYPADALAALEALDDGLTDELMKARLAGVIDAIAGGLYTLSSSASDVLKELGDSPVYLQTNEGSIETYRARYGKTPLMPLSLALWFLGDLRLDADRVDDVGLFPRHAFGTPEFKLLYGTRQLLARHTAVGFDQLPSVKASLDAYNGVTPKREQIDDARYLQFIRSATEVLRFVVDLRNYKAMLSPLLAEALFSAASLFGAPNGLRSPAAGAPGNTVYALRSPPALLQAVITVVESSNQEDEAGKMVEQLGAGPEKVPKREKEQLLNLLDMNIIPINVHALMRDIPLVNIYNYEYSFDQMAAMVYGEPKARTSAPLWLSTLGDDQITSTRLAMLRLLANPFAQVTQRLYGSEVLDLGTNGYVHRMFRGDNDLGMGRPKFLSDQLFNKALFGSVYQVRTDYDEAGPGVGAGISRGRAVEADAVTRALRDLGELRNSIRSLYEVLTAPLTAADVNNDPNLGIASPLLTTGAPVASAVAALAIPANSAPLLRAMDSRLQTVRWKIRDAYQRLNDVRAYLRPPGAARNLVTPVVTRFGVLVNPGGALAELDGYSSDWTPSGTAARVAGPNFVPDLDAIITALAPGIVGSVANLIGPAITGMQPLSAAAAAQYPRRNPNAYDRRPQSGTRASIMTYLRAPDPTGAGNPVVQVQKSAEQKVATDALGKLRFDTRYVRKIVFITNIVRLLRLVLNRELTQNRHVLVGSHMAVAPGVTEYGFDPYSPNEVLDSALPTGASRFDDRDEY